MGRDETRAPLKSPAWEARSWLLLMVFKCWCACGYQLRYTIELNESMNNAQTITKYLPKNGFYTKKHLYLDKTMLTWHLTTASFISVQTVH